MVGAFVARTVHREGQLFVAEAGIEVAYCVDGGVCPLHLTVIDCTSSEAVLVRSGVVHERAIKEALAARHLLRA